MARILVAAATVGYLAAVLVIAALVVRDCGWFALIRGAEWFWLFGRC